MNCGLQYDSRHPALFSGGLNMDTPWMSHHHGLQASVKQEPSDDSYEYGAKERTTNFSSPLTPPGMNSAFSSFPAPVSDYNPATSPAHAFSKQVHHQTSIGQPAETSNTPRSDGKSSPHLTPPGSTPSPVPMETDRQENPHDEGSQSPNSSENDFYESGESLRRLQMMALQRTGMMPEEKLQCPMCEFSCHIRSQFNEHLVSHETKCVHCDYEGESVDKLREHLKTVHDCEDDLWLEEEPGLKVPKVNSQGKVKTFRCKQCEFAAVTKLEFWEHSRTHIKQERLLTCPKCPFVTEYKHHLEYHLRNHFGSKPFKCDKCSYSCVNKSMLNSHLKSHSNVYQFRCSDCTYATKYCHSLKLHLRKYNHSPAMVLNPDGSPNPLPIVDVYGTKRGPKQKMSKTASAATEKSTVISPVPSAPVQQQTPPPPQIPVNFFNPYSLLPTQMPYYNILNGFAANFPFSKEMQLEEKNNNVEKMPEIVLEEPKDEPKAPLDLTCSEKADSEVTQHTDTPIQKNRRKGKAFKLERLAMQMPSSDEEPEQIISKPDLPYPLEMSKSPDIKSCEADSEHATRGSDKEEKQGHNCQYCDISFKDPVMYTMHMGFHDFKDPFTCNSCGQQTTDKVSFFLHIARTSHS
ncbi:Hunchback [Nesidiocoris tenuis]|uniref:Hunchback n=1 Tax=Nesidiocoris tenuis TaxID=355587 RepID=A0ABN7AYN3_9HEMI|nr:Hunchback [Nesidiocoris tenuis]